MIELPSMVLVYAIALLIVIRFGLVPLACAIFTINLMASVPFSADLLRLVYDHLNSGAS